jgi:type IV pilus assembly protein PilO
MMRARVALKPGVRAIRQRIASVFIGLDPDDPSQWPLLPRSLLCVAVCGAVVLVLWLGWVGAVVGSLTTEQAREGLLKSDVRQRLRQAAELDGLKQQVAQVQQRVEQFERQLPGKDDLDALLAEINQAGLQRGLHVELLRPAPETMTEHHAEWSVALRVTGRYHGIGLWVADMAQMAHPVTLHKLSLTALKDRPGQLTLECTARTLRRLEPAEQKTSLPGAGP